MDILSDVKINGGLTVLNKLEVWSSKSTCAEDGIMFANLCSFDLKVELIGKKSYFDSIKASEFLVDGSLRFACNVGIDNLYFRRTNNNSTISNYQKYQSISPFEVPINVPADCSKFIVIGYPMEFLTGSNYSGNYPTTDIPDNQAIHPLVTAWCGGKKIEMDLELCLGEKDSSGKISSEFVIGSVTPSSSERNIRVILY